MKLKEAAEKAGKNENVRKLKGCFLSSGFACLSDDNKTVNEWTILYYNTKRRTVVDCFVNDRFVTVGEETPAIKDMQELDIDSVVISVEEALDIVDKHFKRKTINILISLHMKEFDGKNLTVWTIGMIAPDISVTSFDIDANTGKILKEETTRLIRKV